MISYLLEIGSKITEISDLLTDKWAEVLGWLSIPTIGTALVVCIFKLITAKISQKIAKKNIQPIVQEVKEAKQLFEETSQNLKLEFETKLKEYEYAVKNGIESGFATYENKKNQVCAEILNADDKIKEMVGEIKPAVIDVTKNYNKVIEDVKKLAEEKQEFLEDKVEEIKTEVEQEAKEIETKAKNIKKVVEESDPFAR